MNTKKSKKLLSILLAIGMMLSLLPMTALAVVALPVSGIDWSLDSSGVLTITSDDGMSDWLTSESGKFTYNSTVTVVVIGDEVTAVDASAFSGDTGITGLTLGSSVGTIGANAFNGCTGIITLTLPASVTSIGDSAFEGCSSLRYVTFQGTTVPSIGSTPFDTTSLIDIYVPLDSLSDYTTALGTSYESYIYAMSVTITKNSATTYYFWLSDALESASDGDTITLIGDITESVSNAKASSSDKTVTIDGGGYTITGDTSNSVSRALSLSGEDTVVLKNLTLQGGIVSDESTGLYVEGAINIRSLGTVAVNGGTAAFSFGVYNTGTGTVDVTTATAAGTSISAGAANISTGTVNVGTAEGFNTNGLGVVNAGAGTINVTTATGVQCGANNQSAGTINVTTATGDAYGVYNTSTGTINVTTVTGGTSAVATAIGTVNAGTVTGSVTGTVNTGTDVAVVTLKAGTDAGCVLDSITVAADINVSTAVGALPSVYKDGAYSSTWYTNSAKTSTFSEIYVTGAATLYSYYYEADSSSGTTDGGDSGYSGVSFTAAPTATVSGSTAAAAVTGTISGTTQTVPVASSTMTSLTNAVQTVENAGSNAVAEINTGSNSGLTNIGVTIPGTQFDSFASGTNAALRFTTGLGTVTFSAGAVDTIGAAGSGDVTFRIGTVDTEALNEDQLAAVGDRPVYSFSVTVGGAAVSDFGGSVTVSLPYTLRDGEDPNAVVVCCVDASSSLQMMQGAYDETTGMVTFETTHFSYYVISYNKVDFTDVAETAWYADAVTFLAARSITSGTTATTFGPDVTLTRGQFITLLLRAYGVEADANPTDNFSDAGDTYYTGYLASAKELGVTSGIGDNKFAPDQAITRQEMFTMLYNALKGLDKLPEGTSGKTLSDFADAGDVASWASEAMTALVKAGTVSGSSGKLSPTDTATRAEMAQMLYSLLGK